MHEPIYPYDYFSNRPARYVSPPGPPDNYEDAWRHQAREAARAKPIVVAAYTCAAQTPEQVARITAMYDRQLTALSALLGEPIPGPNRRAW